MFLSNIYFESMRNVVPPFTFRYTDATRVTAGSLGQQSYCLLGHQDDCSSFLPAGEQETRAG